MNWKKVLRWVTFIVNLIVYFAVINMVMMLILRIVAAFGNRNPWWAYCGGLYILLDTLVLYFLARYLFREIVLPSADKRKEQCEQPSRTVTALKYLALMILGGMILLVGMKLIGGFNLFYSGWLLLIFPAVAMATVILGILRPKKRGSDQSVSLLAWGLLLEIPCAFVLFAALSMVPSQFEYRTSELRSWRYFALSTRDVQRCFPPEAKNCRIRGHQGFGACYCWSCECSEPEFLRFARRNGYDIRENDTAFNTDRRMDNTDYFGILQESGISRKPESFYFHNERWPNCGGWTLLYDRKNHILYGEYSDR